MAVHRRAAGLMVCPRTHVWVQPWLVAQAGGSAPLLARIGLTERGLADIGNISAATPADIGRAAIGTGDELVSFKWSAYKTTAADELYHAGIVAAGCVGWEGFRANRIMLVVLLFGSVGERQRRSGTAITGGRVSGAVERSRAGEGRRYWCSAAGCECAVCPPFLFLLRLANACGQLSI